MLLFCNTAIQKIMDDLILLLNLAGDFNIANCVNFLDFLFYFECLKILLIKNLMQKKKKKF